MLWRPSLWVLILTAIAHATEDIHGEDRKTLHHLAGGHLRSDNHVSDLIAESAGGGREKKQQKLDEEEKKTLSQQVADGKYGLIQKELFSKPVKKPGIISYESNPEVAKDTIKNLGGLQKNEIWLAENHLLVLRGGEFPLHEDHKEDTSPLWPPIDDYMAPQRQVKLPAHPKVPPPFPVQLEEGGPLQLLGTNTTRTLNGSVDASAFALPLPEGGYVPGTGPFFPPLYPYPANATAGEAPYPIAPYPPSDSGEYHPGDGPAPFPFPLNGTLPPYFASLPPGAAILPPPDNLTDLYDEDDPSIYYPPPYSFFYPKDNSTQVPPGPLVPGIILPPPPDFFAPLEEKKKEKKPSKTPTRQRKPQASTTEPPPHLHPPTTSLPATSVIDNTSPKKTYLPTEINNELNPTTPRVVTILPVRHRQTTTPPTTNTPTLRYLPQRKKQPSVTILKPVKPDTQNAPIYYKENEVSGHPFAIYGPPVGRGKTIINTTQVPLKIYYSTTNEIETNSVTQDPKPLIYSGISTRFVPKTTTLSPAAQYYYYDEGGLDNSATTQRSIKPSLPDPYLPPTPEPQIFYVTSRQRTTQRPRYRFVEQTSKPDTFKIHLARLRQQLQSLIVPKQNNVFNQRPPQASRPVYQYSFQAANYQQPQQQQQFRAPKVQNDPQDSFKPLPKYSVQIQQAIEVLPTQAPVYQNTPASAPVYYRPSYQVSSERPAPSKYYSTGRPEYDYEDVPSAPRNVEQTRQYVPPQKQQQTYAATPRPISQYSFEATPNPIYQNFYTKPDEKYFDDITKKYFTMFGKKLPSATTPLPPAQATTNNPRPVYDREQQYEQKPLSLESDTLVNYVQPRPQINPDAEYVHIGNRRPHEVYPQNAKYVNKPVAQYVQPQRQPSGAPQDNPQIVQAISVGSKQRANRPGGEEPGSYISYQLPGDEGAHFYFLTPQLVKRTDQSSGYYYPPPSNLRAKRDEQER